jgi:glycosyltransferase involved in cell wall biosynthesis
VRVLQVDAGREWRGGQNQVRLLCRELQRDGVQVQLATQRDGPLARRARTEGIPTTGIRWRISLDPGAVLDLVATLVEFSPDVVHVHDSHALTVVRWAMDFGYWTAEPPPLVASRRVDFHVRRRSGWFKADRVIAVSRAVQAVLIADGLPATAITVIPDGIDPDEVRVNAAAPADVRSRLGLTPDTPLAVNVAALVDHKDHRTLIRAAAAARAGAPRLHWIIAGDGELRHALERDIAQRGLGDIVHLLGYVTEVDALIREASVFVMSSKEEGLGSVILHALALGTPVVATAAGGIPEILPAGCLVLVGDAAALAEKVVSGLTLPSSPVPLPPQFTAKSMSQATLALYRALV